MFPPPRTGCPESGSQSRRTTLQRVVTKRATPSEVSMVERGWSSFIAGVTMIGCVRFAWSGPGRHGLEHQMDRLIPELTDQRVSDRVRRGASAPALDMIEHAGNLGPVGSRPSCSPAPMTRRRTRLSTAPADSRVRCRPPPHPSRSQSAQRTRMPRLEAILEERSPTTSLQLRRPLAG